MVCLGRPTWRVNPELVITELQVRHEEFGRSRHQQLRAVLSAVESSGPSPSSHLQDLVLPVPNRLLRYGPALTFRSRVIVDLLPAQDSTMGVDQKFYSFSSSTYLPPPRSNSVFHYSGQRLWRPSGELARIKRNGGKAGAGWISISSEASEENSERRRKTEGESYGGMFDSNAENVRRRRIHDSPLEPETPQLFSAQGRSRRTQSRGEREWDYESPDADEEPQASPSWFSTLFGDIDDEDEEDEDDDDEGLFSLLNVDLPAALTVFRWGLPALLLLGVATIPSILGNPLTLLFGFAFFPSLAKFLNPLAKQLLRAVITPFTDSSSRRKKRRFRSQSSTTSYRDQGPVRYNVNGSNAQTAGRSPDSSFPREDSALGPSGFGGWDDLAEDGNGSKSPSQWPLQKRKKTSKKLSRREQPLFIRLILALFPFLRGWGGLL